jgi:putative peptidoglycan lipid II flippase
MGLIRESVFAHFLGSSVAAGAFKAALRIPNFLQTLLGEGVLSASFIPVYARLIGRGEREEADRLAGAVFGLLSLMTALLVAVGLLITPVLIDLIAPGFQGESRELTIRLVRILFPGIGFLVLAAWCLGILNSHGHFFLSYAAPVAWNVVQIAVLLALGTRSSQSSLVTSAAFAVVAGSVLQFAIQLPTVLGLLGRFRPGFSAARESVRQVIRSFIPVVLGRGVVQVSAWIDTAFSSLISPRAVAQIFYAQQLYLLPVSLFGMAVSAAELPAMSRATGDPEQIAAQLRARINQGLARIAFFVVPSAAALLFLGDVVGGAAFRILPSARFTTADQRYLWYLLMGSSLGLLPATMGRLYASAFYALKDARTPFYLASLRVLLGACLAYWSAVRLPEQLGFPRELGGLGLTASSGLSAWVEFRLLRNALNRQIGATGLGARKMLVLWGAAGPAALAGIAVKWMLSRVFGTMNLSPSSWEGNVLAAPALPPPVTAVVVLGCFGALYLFLTLAFRVPESQAVLRRVRHH